MSPNKTHSMIGSRSRTLQLEHPDLFIDNVLLTTIILVTILKLLNYFWIVSSFFIFMFVVHL